jgi:hypothetical protein
MADANYSAHATPPKTSTISTRRGAHTTPPYISIANAGVAHDAQPPSTDSTANSIDDGTSHIPNDTDTSVQIYTAARLEKTQVKRGIAKAPLTVPRNVNDPLTQAKERIYSEWENELQKREKV